VGKYQSHDHKTHEAAHALGQAAKSKDGVAVIAAFQSIQSGCYGCHREFRKPFVEHFYGVR
jgi:cytochrome c556